MRDAQVADTINQQETTEMKEMATETRGKRLKEVTAEPFMRPGPNEITALRKFLDDCGERELPVTDALVRLLQGCWHNLQGSGETRMAAWKLERIEQVRWDPPVLSFVVERHGAAVLGSI